MSELCSVFLLFYENNLGLCYTSHCFHTGMYNFYPEITTGGKKLG